MPVYMLYIIYLYQFFSEEKNEYLQRISCIIFYILSWILHQIYKRFYDMN